MDLQLITQLSQAGVGVVSLVAVVVLWRHLIALQRRYEAVLERCVAALVRVNDHLEKLEEEL